jgi:hypothetical protein
MISIHNTDLEKDARLEFESLLYDDKDFREQYGTSDDENITDYNETDFQEWYIEQYQNKTDFIKLKLRELKKISEELTRSDLQGLVMVEALKFNNQKQEEIENILLLFCDDELNINEAKRFLLELI